MANFNRVILVGRLTRDVELKCTQTGTPVTDVGLAVTDRRKTANGDWIDEPMFVDVTFWGRTAEVASEYLSKGAPVLIEGRLKLDQWETDGQKRSKLRVVCERMQMLGSRGSGDGGSAPQQGGAQRSTGAYQEASVRSDAGAPPAAAAPAAAPDDDIPF